MVCQLRIRIAFLHRILGFCFWLLRKQLFRNPFFLFAFMIYCPGQSDDCCFFAIKQVLFLCSVIVFCQKGKRMEAKKKIEQRLKPVLTQLEAVSGLPEMFRGCFMNTLDTTVTRHVPGDTFIITGDIEAMWLRDSTAQVLHYVRFADDSEVAAMIEGLLARQAACVAIDPYANAFNETASSRHWDSNDLPKPDDRVWERKYEIDSLCWPLLLAERLEEKTGSRKFLTPAFHQMMKTIVRVFRREQHHENSEYRFIRHSPYPEPDLGPDGRGAPVAPAGMTWSGFRPSDDACRYGYLVPSNLFAASVLRSLIRFADNLGDSGLAEEAALLRKEILEGLEQHAVVGTAKNGEIWCYETDALGHHLLMDDANCPSLLCLPWLGICSREEPRYLRTRAFVLSRDNPYYYSGSAAEGVGSPHTPKGFIWPIGLCVQILTSVNDEEAAAVLRMLLTTHAGTCLMHESFDPNRPEKFTRSWFAWANSMFGEAIHTLYDEGRLQNVLALSRVEKV